MAYTVTVKTNYSGYVVKSDQYSDCTGGVDTYYFRNISTPGDPGGTDPSGVLRWIFSPAPLLTADEYHAFMEFDLSATPKYVRPYKIELKLYINGAFTGDLNPKVYFSRLVNRPSTIAQSGFPPATNSNQGLYDLIASGSSYYDSNPYQWVSNGAYITFQLNASALADLFTQGRQWLAVGAKPVDWTSDTEYITWANHLNGNAPLLVLYYYDDPCVD